MMVQALLSLILAELASRDENAIATG